VQRSALPDKRRRKLLSLFTGSLVGWVLVIAEILGWPVLIAQFGDFESAQPAREQLPPAIFLMALFGIPIAAIARFLVGWPIWEIADRIGATRAWHGMILGAATGALIVLGLTAL